MVGGCEMLNRLLSLLATGSVHTPEELATQLGVAESLLDQMLEDLARMGYLRQVSGLTCQPSSSGGSSACEHAALCIGCSLGNAGRGAGETGDRVWTLTDKAFRLEATRSS